MSRHEWYILLCTLLSFVLMAGGVLLAATSCQDRVLMPLNGPNRCDPDATITVYAESAQPYAICSCPKDTP